MPAFVENQRGVSDDGYFSFSSSRAAAHTPRSRGRPTPVYHCERLSRKIGNCQIYLKREDLNHSGAHGSIYRMGRGVKVRGKTRIIAETGAGRDGVAPATAAASSGF